MKEITVKKVIEIINGIINDTEITTEQLNEDLYEFGMDSMMFIEVVVSLEEEFDCEIPDSKLLISEMNTVNKIYNVLISMKEVKSFEPEGYMEKS